MTSSDVPIGLPYNIVGYATLLHLLAREVGYIPHKLYYKGGDVHIYENQLPFVDEQLANSDKLKPLPELHITGEDSMFMIKPKDIHVEGYESNQFINYPVS